MVRDSLPSLNSQQESPDVRITIATEEDWEVCSNLRTEAIDSKDAELLGFTPNDQKSEVKKLKEKSRAEAEWRQELSNPDTFYVLSRTGNETVGMGYARKLPDEKEGEGWWWMGQGYVKEGFRGNDAGKKMFATRLKEIIRRGGKKVRIGVKANNDRSIHIAETFGFKKLVEDFFDPGFYMELTDTSNPENIKKINEVLDAG